jgi:hypothetical protein
MTSDQTIVEFLGEQYRISWKPAEANGEADDGPPPETAAASSMEVVP